MLQPLLSPLQAVEMHRNLLLLLLQIQAIEVESLLPMSSLSTLDLQNNDIAQVPPQLGNVTQLRWDGAGRSFQLGRTLWSLSSIFLSLDIAVSGIRHFINTWHSVLFSQPRQKKVHRLFITLWKKTCIALLYVLDWFYERNLMFHVNIEEHWGGSGRGGGAKTVMPQGKKSKYRTVLSRKNPNAMILCPARLEPQYRNLILKLQKDCFKISESVTDINEV